MLKYNIIPKPQKYIAGDGTFVVSSATQVLCAEEFVGAGNFISNYLKTKPQQGEGAIKFKKKPGMEKEAYSLKVTTDGIVVCASEANGAFYGAVTLKMILMQAEKKDSKAIVSTLLIEDKPDNDFRGLMLDSSRHFFTVDVIKDLLDNMAFLKLNKFHWHLSDDQGFRIESKLFPQLNEIGSRRTSRHLKGFDFDNDGIEDFNFYSQDDIKDIVAYAGERHIEVIPEIDMPGHTMAILAAMPQFCCVDEPVEVMTSNGVSKAIFCVGNEDLLDFIDKLFSEICPLFPSAKFHIGGDEAFEGYKLWAKCEKCQALKSKLCLKTEKDLQIWFMCEITKILKKYGKSPIAWDDCMGDELDTSVACQYWQTKSMREVRKQASKRDIIISATPYFYFDVKYSAIPLKKTYKFNKIKVGLGGDAYKVSGLECELWTEWIDGRDALEFSVYPRTVAFAEVAWTKLENRNYNDFYKRLDWFKTYMNIKNINYSRVEKRRFDTRQKCYYSLGADGSEYKKSMELKK